MSLITGNYVDLRQLRKLHLILHDITDCLFQSNFQKYPDKYIPIYRIDIQKGPALLKNISHFRGWKDGSMVNNTGCSSKAPGFGFQHSHGRSQTSVAPVSGDPMPCSRLRGHDTQEDVCASLHRHCIHVVHRYPHG